MAIAEPSDASALASGTNKAISELLGSTCECRRRLTYVVQAQSNGTQAEANCDTAEEQLLAMRAQLAPSGHAVPPLMTFVAATSTHKGQPIGPS